MKKVLIILFIIGSSGMLSAQSLHLNTRANVNSGLNHSRLMQQIGNENYVPYADKKFIGSDPVTGNTARKERGGETIIGTTTWDDHPSGQRLFAGRGGTLSAVWTGSLWESGSSGSLNAFPDRGTFYNYFDGNNWGSYPTKRIENVYCGYSANVFLKNKGELIFAHVNEDTVLGTSHRLQVGIDTFKFAGSNPQLNVMWPHATAWEDTVHVIGAKLISPGNNYMQYFRSTDGGQSWDNVNQVLPKIDTADCIKYMTGETYSIDVRGSTVAIVGGGNNNTMYLWKSLDNGNTWNTTVIWNFSICGMDGHVVVPDPIETSDGSYSIILDNHNMAHIFCGFTRISDNDASADLWSFEPQQNALLYWNETYPADSLILVGESPDRDNDGQLNIGQDPPNYSNVSLASMPTAAMDTSANIIYCVFAVAMENTDLFNDYRGQSFRDLFGIYSTDEGKTWSKQANLTNTADFQVENVYPSAAKYTRNGTVDVIWMRDNEPGNSLDMNQKALDAVHSNDIVFKSFSIDDFNYDGVKNVSASNDELELFPNPSEGIININLTGLGEKSVRITVTNILGQTIKSFADISGKNLFQLNLKGIESGMYFVKAETEEKTLAGKIIIGKN